MSRTLKEFRTLWNLLGDPHLRIEVPARIGTTAYLRIDKSLRPTKLKLIETGRILTEQYKFLQKNGEYRVSSSGGDLGHFSIYSPVQVGDLGSLKINSFIYHAGFDRIGPTGLNGRAELIIPIISNQTVQFDGQAVLISHTSQGANWKHGNFEYAFRQLNTITTDYEALDVDTIERILKGEAERTGESFEALGIKFPAENTTRWGLVLILGIQIYFWIHLRELLPKVSINDPGWGVAWVGVYPSYYAKTVMFVSTFILPVAAILALGLRGLYLSSFALTYWALVILGTGAALGLSILIWRRLPQQILYGRDDAR